jgi:hypothetical protein
MKKKILSLPVIISGLLMSLSGYYWGALTQQGKIVAVQLDQTTNTLKTNTGSTPTNINSSIPTNVVPAANTSVSGTQSTNTVNNKPVVSPGANIPVKTVSPQKIAPAATTPSAAAKVTQPVQPPAAAIQAPTPTTKVS